MAKKPVDITKATPRPWIKTGQYVISGPGYEYDYKGKKYPVAKKKVMVARANQEYRTDSEDAANVELAFRAVAFADEVIADLEYILQHSLDGRPDTEETAERIRKAINKFKDGE